MDPNYTNAHTPTPPAHQRGLSQLPPFWGVRVRVRVSGRRGIWGGGGWFCPRLPRVILSSVRKCWQALWLRFSCSNACDGLLEMHCEPMHVMGVSGGGGGSKEPQQTHGRPGELGFCVQSGLATHRGLLWARWRWCSTPPTMGGGGAETNLTLITGRMWQMGLPCILSGTCG